MVHCFSIKLEVTSAQAVVLLDMPFEVLRRRQLLEADVALGLGEGPQTGVVVLRLKLVLPITGQREELVARLLHIFFMLGQVILKELEIEEDHVAALVELALERVPKPVLVRGKNAEHQVVRVRRGAAQAGLRRHVHKFGLDLAAS